MIKDALKNKILKPGDTIIEATGDNTGLGLAICANLIGVKTIFCIPNNFSKEKVKILKHYGAKIEFSDNTNGSHIKLAKEILKNNPTLIN